MRLLFLIPLLLSSSYASNPIDMDTLISAGLIEVPPCYQSCISDVIHATRELFFFKDTVHNFRQLCSTYENASLCVSEQEVSCIHQSSFASNIDSILSMCKSKSSHFDSLMPCVDKNIDSVLNECDSTCLFTSSVSEMSRRESIRSLARSNENNRYALISELSELCPSTSCFISCISKSLDTVCPPAGNDIISVLLRPFYVYAEMIDQDEDFKKIVFQMTPPTCYAFITEDGLQKMQDGEYSKPEHVEQVNELLVRERTMDVEEEHHHEMNTVDNDESDVSRLLSVSPMTSCTDSCLSDLLIAAAKVLSFNNTLNNFESLCNTYENASLCVARQEISCIHEASFVVGVSGLEELCQTKKEQFAKHTSCISSHIDDTLRSCDDSCQFSYSLSLITDNEELVHSTIHGADVTNLYQELAPICSSTGCMLSCIARTLNRDCEPAGTEIVEALLRPFTRMTDMMIQMGPEAIETVRAQLPSTCSIFVSVTDLDDIAKGVESPSWASPIDAMIAAAEESEEKELEQNILIQDKDTVEEMHETESVWGGRPGQINRGNRMDYDFIV